MSRFSSSKGPSQRQLRAGELVRHALAEILQREDLREPALRGLSITVSEVRTSPDLKQATAFVTPLGGGAKGADVPAVVAALNRVAPHLRGHLGKKIDMKFTPALKFLADESFDEAQKIEALLHRPEVARDLDGGEKDD
ncbi:MAG: 30S ribosome-binding factor RbfA [Parvularculaceae bacterium]|nr:30S ribosome-binding factor RbfA [Parvularculaceae bacterium]